MSEFSLLSFTTCPAVAHDEPPSKRRRLDEAAFIDSILLNKRRNEKHEESFTSSNQQDNDSDAPTNYDHLLTVFLDNIYETPRSSTPVSADSWDTSFIEGESPTENDSSFSSSDTTRTLYLSAIDHDASAESSVIILSTRDACLQNREACKGLSVTITIDHH